MKVACPHCHAAYNVDDRRIPASGLNVRCTKCRNAFPVRAPDGGQAGAVPLPAPASATAASSAAPRPAPPTATMPRPAPPAAPPARPPSTATTATMPRPARPATPPPRPASLATPPPSPPPRATRPAAPPPHPTPPATPPPRPPSIPLPPPLSSGPPPRPAPAASALVPPMPAAEVPFGEADAVEAEPFPVPPVTADEQESSAGSDPLPVPPALGNELDLSSEPSSTGTAPGAAPAPAEPLGFGEVDFGEPPPPEPRPPRPPEPIVAPEPAAREPPAMEELEMLFGDGAAKPAAASGAAAGYKVRRRSGKIFGPFDVAQVVEMLGKGELMGNEDVSGDGGGSWTPIGAIPAFGEALRTLSAEPVPARGRAAGPAAREPRRGAPRDARAVAAQTTEGGAPARRWARIVVPAAAVLLLALAGAGAGFTRYGFFFTKAFRRADAVRMAALAKQIRVALARDDYPSGRTALDLAAKAVAADPDGSEAASLHAIAVAALEQRHGAPPEALAQARRAADRLEQDEKGSVEALATRLAVTLATTPGAATAPLESALDQAAQGRPPDAEIVALIAAAALARGDLPRAGALYGQLEALEPAGPRVIHGQGLVRAARRDAAGAKTAFEKALASAPEHLASRIELAALAEAAGDAAGAEAQLGPLLAPPAAAKLGPAERARALAIRAALLARSAATSAEADKAFEAAVQADGRLVEVRIALARYRLRRGDAAGAVAALDPVAQEAAAKPALAAMRIRALAAAGRLLDAASVAEAALQKFPGDPAILLAQAASLESSGKPDEAAALYRDAAARDPAAFEPRLALGRIALARGDTARAATEIAAAVEKGPREPAAHTALGELEAAQGRAPAAEAAFRAALAIDAEYAPAEIGLAKLALARGDAAGARARLQRALAADPRGVEGYVAYGTIFWNARDLPAAEKAFQAAVDLKPLHAVALARLGAVKLERDDVDGAVMRLTAASNEDPKLAEARRWLGRALLRKNETPGAIAQLRKAVELEPRNPENQLHLGSALERSGALVEAIEAYRAATALDPKYVDAWERMGNLYAANGHHEDAIRAYERAIAAAPRLSRLRLALGESKMKLGKNAEAAKIFRDVLKSDPSAVQALYRLARALHESEGARAALPYYERAAREDARNPMPHYYLGYLYKEKNLRVRAIQEFRKYLELRPDAEEKKDVESEIDDLGGGKR